MNMEANYFNDMKKKAITILYILSRVFKHKKIKDSNDRRILSYTLDIISKLSVDSYREGFFKLVRFTYDTIYPIKIN
jgi:hypothetical protein